VVTNWAITPWHDLGSVKRRGKLKLREDFKYEGVPRRVEGAEDSNISNHVGREKGGTSGDKRKKLNRNVTSIKGERGDGGYNSLVR